MIVDTPSYRLRHIVPFELDTDQVHFELARVARNQPHWNLATHVMPFFSVNLLKTVAYSGARSAIITINGPLEDAYTMMGLCMSMVVPVPLEIDRRGMRFPKTRWVDQKGAEWRFARRPRTMRVPLHP